MSAQEDLISYLQALNIEDQQFNVFKKMIEQKLISEDGEDELSGEFREDVFNKEIKKNDKKVNKKNSVVKASSNKHQGPIRINPNNPKKMNCKSWTLYESYKKAESFQQFKDLGGETKHYNYDLKKGLIIELTEEQIKILDEDPEYDFFKKDPSEEDEISKKKKPQKKKSSEKAQTKKSPDPVNVDQKEEDNSSKNEKDDTQEKILTENKKKSSLENTSSKNLLSKEPEQEMSQEDLNIYLEAVLDKIIDEIISQENFENKRENITNVKKKLFEDPDIKKNFKKNNKDLNTKINDKYNQKSSVFEKQCKEDFNDVFNHQKPEESKSDSETEEIDVCIHEQDGVTYHLDPKTNILYDDSETEARKVGVLKDGIIIFD